MKYELLGVYSEEIELLKNENKIFWEIKEYRIQIKSVIILIHFTILDGIIIITLHSHISLYSNAFRNQMPPS